MYLLHQSLKHQIKAHNSFENLKQKFSYNFEINLTNILKTHTHPSKRFQIQI